MAFLHISWNYVTCKYHKSGRRLFIKTCFASCWSIFTFNLLHWICHSLSSLAQHFCRCRRRRLRQQHQQHRHHFVYALLFMRGRYRKMNIKRNHRHLLNQNGKIAHKFVFMVKNESLFYVRIECAIQQTVKCYTQRTHPVGGLKKVCKLVQIGRLHSTCVWNVLSSCHCCCSSHCALSEFMKMKQTHTHAHTNSIVAVAVVVVIVVIFLVDREIHTA